MARATSLLLTLCGGAAAPVQEVRSVAYLPVRKPVLLRRSRLQMLSGAHIDDGRITACLGGLGMKLEPHWDGWEVTPPTWRFDIAIEADLIEEVLRIVGFDAVQEQPRRLPQRAGIAADTTRLRRAASPEPVCAMQPMAPSHRERENHRVPERAHCAPTRRGNR